MFMTFMKNILQDIAVKKQYKTIPFHRNAEKRKNLPGGKALPLLVSIE